MSFDQQQPSSQPGTPGSPPDARWEAPAPTPQSAPAPQPGVTVPVAPVVRPRRSSSRLLDAALLLAGLLAVGGVAFGVGRATAPVAAAANGTGTFRNGGGTGFRPNGSFDPNAAPGRGGAFALGGGLSIDGTVKSVTADSLTLTLANGQDVTFSLDSSTTYHQATTGSASDVAVGNAVSVKVKGNGRFFGQGGGQGGNGGQASPAPSASGAPGSSGSTQLQASDITVTH
jgi:hypothetical protein